MPSNVDNFDLRTSHVLPALIRKFHEAKETGAQVKIWGSGRPRHEFLFSDEVADAIRFLLERGGIEGFVNVGTGSSVSIRELAETIQRVVGHQGEMVWNTSMLDGPREDDGRFQATRAGLAASARAGGRHPPSLRLVP